MTSGPYQLSGGPAWLTSETFDIEAGVPAGTKEDHRFSRLRLMLQSWPEGRFHFGFHHETNELSVYAPEVAKSGPKLRQLTGERPGDGAFRTGRGHISAQAVPLVEAAIGWGKSFRGDAGN